MRLALLTTVAILWVSSSLTADENSTVGIGRSNDHPAQQTFLARVTKLLSDEPTINVVPVTDVVLPGSIPSETLLRDLGKRNGAALHLQLEVSRTGEPLGFTIHDTRHGNLLDDVTLRRGSPEGIPRLAAISIRRADAKRKSKDAHRVAVVRIDTTGLPLADQLPLAAMVELFERNLSRSEHFTVAPRGDAAMDKVTAPDVEVPLSLKALAGENANEIALELTRSDERFRLVVDRLDGVTVDKLSHSVWHQLQVDPPKPLLEATARHTVISENLWANGDKSAALRAAERAALCAPEDVATQRRLSNWLLGEVELHSRTWRPGEQQQFAARAFRIERQLVDDLSLDDPRSLLQHVRYPEAVLRLHSMMNIVNRLEEQFEDDELARLRGDHYRCATRPIELYRQAAVRDPELVLGFSLALGHRMHFLCRIKSNSETPPGQAAVSAASQWLDLFDALPEERKPWSRVNIVLRDLTLTNQVRDRDIVTPLYKRLENHSHPLLRLLGKRGRMTHDWSLVKADADTQVEQFRTLRKEAIQTLDKVHQQGNRAAASETVRFLDESFNSLRLTRQQEFINEMLATSDALLQRGIAPDRMLLDACQLADESNAKRAYELLGKLKKVRGGSTNGAEQQLVRLESLFPVLRKEPRKSPVELKELLDARKLDGQPFLLHPLVRDNRVYAIALSNAGDSAVAQLIAVPLEGGEHQLLGRVKLPVRFGSSYEGENLIVTAAYTEPNTYYAAVRDLGILQFDLRKERVSTLVASDMLPKGVVRSLAFARGQLYVGMEGGKLLLVGMMTGDADTLVATDSKVVNGPLDDRPPFDIPLLLSDKNRNRLLVFVLDRHSEGRGGEIWEYDLASGKLKRLERLGGIQLGLSASLQGDTLMLADTWFMKWNLKTAEKTAVANYALGELTPARKLWVSGLNQPPVYCQDSFWWLKSDGALGRFKFPDGDPEFHLSEKLRRDPGDTVGRSGALPVDDKRLLLQHARSLWLATPQMSP